MRGSREREREREREEERVCADTCTYAPRPISKIV
jgi:hypothetical protein